MVPTVGFTSRCEEGLCVLHVLHKGASLSGVGNLSVG